MAPRLEFLAYYLVLLVGVSAYFLETRAHWLIFLAVVAAHLVVLRFLCRHLARRFRFDGRSLRADL